MQSNPQSNSSSGLSTPAQFRSKLGTYLTGVIIGFMILAGIYYQKYLSTQRIEAEAKSQQTENHSPASTGSESKP
jgi:uncharacterized membrane protein YciS (DUF1049 family)